VNKADAAPPGMVRDAGTVTAGLLEDRETTDPPVGALPDKVTVQVLPEPPTTVAGAHCWEESVGGWTLSDAVCDEPAQEAVMVAACVAATGVLETETVTEGAPAGTVMAAGTLTAALLEDKEIETPPAGAAPGNVTVQVLLEPPNTDDGAHWNWKRIVRAREVVKDAPP
jgi:hypothetical protein